MPIEPLCAIACEGVGAERNFAPLWVILPTAAIIPPLIMRKPWHGLIIYFVLLFLWPTNAATGWSMFKEALALLVLVLTLFSHLLAQRSSRSAQVRDTHKHSFLLPKGYLWITVFLAFAITISSYHLLMRPEFYKPTTEASEFVARWKYLQVLNSVLLGAITLQLVRTLKDFESLQKVIVISGLILALHGLMIYPFRDEAFAAIGYNPVIRVHEFQITERLVDFTRISSAEIGRVYMWPALLALFWGISLLGRPRAIMLSTGLVILLAIVLTFTRAAYLGVLISVVTFVILTPSFRHLRGLAVLTIFTVCLGAIALLSTFASPETDTGQASCASCGEGIGRFTRPQKQIYSRSGAWAQAIDAAKVAPITGHGFGTSTRITARLMAETGAPGAPGRSLHQFYLDWLIDTGILGLAVLFILIFMVGHLLLKTIYQSRRVGNIQLSTYASILLAVLPSALVFVLFDSAFILPQLFFWLALAYILRRFMSQQPSPKSHSPKLTGRKSSCS